MKLLKIVLVAADPECGVEALAERMVECAEKMASVCAFTLQRTEVVMDDSEVIRVGGYDGIVAALEALP